MTHTPEPTTVPSVDLDRYLGTWYEIARLPMRHEPPDYRNITATYSRTLEEPLDRLRATMIYIYAVALGTDEDRRAIKRMVDRAHAPVRGPGYRVFDPQLQLWVAAPL